VLGAEGNVLSFERSYEAERILVALNFGNDSCALPDSIARNASVLLSTHMDVEGPFADPTLRGNEGIILRVNS
jgi:hypothetical protein